ncbi:sel1 repeat family protein [Burkholderia sp. Ax-1719]|uniref:SEL1-like repeat protein n=1 Tax=Burkholderia sp. Ax-1719 TaxID=2608334 RepID=UPI0019656D89|nr:sel1 repeat family protein [Burkholderia sp. Ax-1719]NIE68008.1 sel1 repeat family protein [Burkholderia sp. Ax-1719]
MRRGILVALLTCLACACTKESPLASLPDLSAVRANLAFTCVHEDDHLPPLDPDADRLFKYGRWLQKQDGPKDFNDIARYYRIAAANGHYKANNNLQQLISTGLADSPNAQKESVDLAIQLVHRGVPGGYYDIAHYLELGYGLKQDSKTALRYFRKAADLGSPDAQYYVAEKLDPIDAAPDVALQMYRCAADQGHGLAATSLANGRAAEKFYAEAVKAFQQGVMAGNSMAASFLEEGFKGPLPDDRLNYLALPKDLERSRRYELIGNFLDVNEGLNPKMPDIDQIVPLPPAELPAWDGTFQWQKEQDAAKPPQKPGDKLVERLAREKNLDPATGLPLAPAKSAHAEPVPLGTVVRTGEVCPQSGVWCDKRWASVSYEATQRFRKGETMPQFAMDDRRPIPFLDTLLGMRKFRTNADWSLVSYDERA